MDKVKVGEAVKLGEKVKVGLEVKIGVLVKVGLKVFVGVKVRVAKGLEGLRVSVFWQAVTQPMASNKRIEMKRRGFIRVPKSFFG
jgi:UDP-3-O-[3-hydroxymyristoyl] glucosamine N-acyltransferase